LIEESCRDGSPGRNESSDCSLGGLNSSPSSWENVDEKEIGDKVFSFTVLIGLKLEIFPLMGKEESSIRNLSHIQSTIPNMFPGSCWSTDPVGTRPSCPFMHEM
jgi:hypothetical protein